MPRAKTREEHVAELAVHGRVELVGEYRGSRQKSMYRCLIHNEKHEGWPNNTSYGGGLLCCRTYTGDVSLFKNGSLSSQDAEARRRECLARRETAAKKKAASAASKARIRAEREAKQLAQEAKQLAQRERRKRSEAKTDALASSFTTFMVMAACGLSIDEIAQSTLSPPHAVHRLLASPGMYKPERRRPKQKPGSYRRNEKVEAMVMAACGVPMWTIGSVLGRDDKTVARWLKPDLVQQNRDRERASRKREVKSAYTRMRTAEDPAFRIATARRSRRRDALKAAAVRRKSSGSCEELFGCSSDALVAYMESKFAPGMSWDNHGEWHIDEIKPCSAFDLVDPEQQRICFHFLNCQPLWKADNLRKGATWTDMDEAKWRKELLPLIVDRLAEAELPVACAA